MFISKAWAEETSGAHSTDATQDATHTETGVAHDPAHDAGHGGAFPPFDPASFASQLLWLAITFGVFYLLMARVAIPRISSILEVRRDRISQDLDEANRMRDEADAAHAAYEHELAEARKNATAIAQKANDEAKAAAEAERQKTEAELGAKLAEAEARIADIRAKALGDVDEIASMTAETIVKELLGGTVTKAELSRAVSEAAKQGA
ncbi:MAG: F0F1 ATP synthase subunit B [Nitratireductor sp.]|nr:F0F1 ATP synthase subunit B [Nitratireductor sp.]